MKIKAILALSALSLGLTGLASAQTTNFVYLTGSSAFRPTTYDAIVSLFDSAPVITVDKISALSTNADPHTGGRFLFAGTISSNNYVIKCAWSGSEAGIADATAATGGRLQTFLATSYAFNTTNTFTTATLSSTESHTVDLIMADNEQGYSLTKTPALTGKALGVVPFLWLKNAQTNSTYPTAPADWSRLTNVTDPMLRQALTGGSPLALFTGNPADTNWVYVVGRDNQSGTYVNTMLNTQRGLVGSPSQIKINNVGNLAVIAGGALVTGQGADVGGYASGGTVVTALGLPGSGNSGIDPIYSNATFQATGTAVINGGWYAIGYAGLYDADSALGINGFAVNAPYSPAVALTYNGVAETPDNIKNGTYSYWGNEYIYKSKNNLSAGGGVIYTKLLTAIPASMDLNHTFPYTAMLASKSSAASNPAHN
jgi:hypothetical protein